MLLRVIAALVDFLIVFWVGLPLTPFFSSAVLVAGGAIFVYRYIFGRTPGQQLAGGSWQRGLGAIVAVTYVGATIGGGFFIAHLTDEKLDAKRVRMTVVDVARPASPAAGNEQEFERVSFMTPRNGAGYVTEEVSCCVLFGGGNDEAVLQPGIAVVVMNDLHPYDYCRGLDSRNTAWVVGCAASPLAYQQKVTEISPAARLWSVSPLGVVRRNFALVAKNSYFDEADAGEPMRRFRSGDAEVLWLRASRTIKKARETTKAEIDRFLIANATSYAAVDVIWKKVPRDAALAGMIASSIRLQDAPQTVATREIAAAAGGDGVRHLTNAFRVSGRAPEVARLLRDTLAREGTQRQKHYFSQLVTSEAKRKPEMRAVAASVDAW